MGDIIKFGQRTRRPRRRRPGLGAALAVAIAVFAGLCYDQISDGVGIWSAEGIAAPGTGGARQPSVRVVDGDTFWHDGEKIRVADIDTPEVNGRCPYESALAARATSRFGELLRAGPFDLVPISGRDEDRYGRKLRVVVRDGRSLGDVLVAEGLARTWTGRREPWC